LYFLAEIPPAADLPPAPPADVLVLADTSSSMKELAPMRQAVREIVESLRPQDRVRLVCGDVATRPLHEGWLEPLGGTAAGRDGAAAGRPPRQTGKPQGEGGKKAARRAKRRAAEQEGIPSRRLLSALEQLDAQFALGGTNLDSCLREAVASFEDAAGARRRLLIYVGDGVDESGRPQESAAWKTLAERLEEAQTVFVALIVRRPAKPQAHLAQLAAASGGLMFDLADDLRAPRELFRWLLAGLPTPERILQAAVAGAKPEDVYCPGTWVPGQPLYVYGRMPEGREVQLSLTLGRGSQKRTQQVTLAAPAGQDDVFVGRLWAQRRLEQWLRLDLDKDQDARKRVLALSQEWSLLSPYTAFLVLESEQDYQRWQVDRRARRRYWRPADARPEAPLPPSWVDRVTAPRKGKTAEERPLSTLRDAREATNAGRYSQALDLLLQMKHAPQAKSAEYDRLRERAVTGLRARDFVESLGLHRGLFDPAAKTPGWALRPSVMSLVAGAHYRDPDFFRRRPHAEKLCQDVDLGAFAKPQSLAGFADVLRRLTGTNVVLDREAMKQAGVDVDSRLEPLNVQCDSAPAPDNPFTAPPRPGSGGRKKPRAGADEDPFAQPADQSAPREPSKPREPAQLPAGKMSLRSFVHHRLKALDLVLSEEPHRLLITTKENLPSTTEVYPVADLLFTDRVAPPELLSNPLVDHFEKARRRIEGKLKQPVTLDYVEVPLRDVAADLAARLAEPVLLDSKALAQAGIDQDRPVTASYREVPAQKALQWLLHDHDVVFTVWDDVLVITTKEEADARLVVQLHSGRGLLYEFPMPANAASQWQGPTGFGPTPFGAGRSSRGRAQAHGFGGGMGGMGGMAGSGMGSMGSMGSMFGGGTSRPYVTGVIPAVDGSKLSGTAGLSTGGDGTAAPSAPDKHPLAEPELAVMGGVAGGAAVAYDYDRDTLVDLVTSTIAPQSWDSVGGPGCVDFFPATLDFVFAQTREVHEQVAELFERLRRLPVQASAKSGARPATVHPQVVEDFSHADFDTLIDLITSTLEPQSWDSVGGAGSIEAEPTRVALVVSQTPDVHQQLSRLLLLLRRSRYESVRGGQPWEAELGPTTRGPAAAEATPADVSEPRRLVDFPAANLAELAALRARRDPAAGRWRWRRVVADSTRSEVAFRSAGPRCEFGFGSATVRTEGDLAAVAWPRLKLVEHGNYAEVLRRAMDAQLPWMPHRSNEELARLFEVFERPPDSSLARRAGAEETGPDGPTGAPSPASTGQPDVVWLRLIPAGLPRDGDTYLQIAYSRTERLPVQWEAYVAGKRTGRIWFEDPVRDGTLAEWRKAILEDAEGRELVRWELIEAKAEGGVIPELTSGWDGYIHLDCRAPRPILDAPFVEAVTALRESHWDRAAELLQRLPEETERHPLVRLLRAWCIEHDEGLGSRSLLATLLRTAAQDDAPEVLRFIAEGNFRSLSDAARYALMTSQPEPSRTGDDYDRLAHVATGLGKLPEALACIDVALKRGEGDAQVPARQRLRIELLLRLGRTTEAVADAERWLTPGRAATEDVATVAELFAAHAQPATAERLFHAALADRRLTAEQRYGLLLRAAAARQGSERCRALLEAASLQPPGSSGRTACLQQLRQELATPAHAGIAAQLMAYTEDAELIAELLVREAELTQDKNRAGDLAWQVYESGRLGDTRLDWACRLWQQAGQAERVIRTCEAALRAGRSLRSTTQDALAQAYRESGRPSDARRAASRDVPPQPAEPTRPPPGMGGGMF
jgi:tetratricopeptide (TPR) repeat protein